MIRPQLHLLIKKHGANGLGCLEEKVEKPRKIDGRNETVAKFRLDA